MWQTVREFPVEVHDQASSLASEAWVFDRVRALNPHRLSRTERAARFIYLNRNCFNGLFRTNKEGQFNVPYAPAKTGQLPSVEAFQAAATRLGRAEIRPWDFGTTLRHCKAGDFVYLDPPYMVERRRVFREYGSRPFSSSDLGRLAAHLKKLDNRGATFLLSYAASREARDLASGWRIKYVTTRRNIAGFADARRKAREVLISNAYMMEGNGHERD